MLFMDSEMFDLCELEIIAIYGMLEGQTPSVA